MDSRRAERVLINQSPAAMLKDPPKTNVHGAPTVSASFPANSPPKGTVPKKAIM